MKILLYNIRNFNAGLVTKHTIILVKEIDVTTFKQYSLKMKLQPRKVYKIFNFLEGYEELFTYYLKYHKYKHYSFVPSLKLLVDWNDFIELYNTRQYSQASSVLSQMDSVPIYFDTSYLKLNLLKFINKVKIPYFEKGIFLQNKLHLKVSNDNWIKEEYSYFDFISKLTFNDPKWNHFNIHIQNLIDSLSPYGITDQLEKKLFSLSLYYYKMAFYYLRNNNYVVSYTLLHRSLDTFYQYKCRKAGSSLRLATNGKLKYRSSNSMVTLSNSETCLFGLTANTLFIDNLNNRRNKLFLTHGPYSITKNELISKFKEVKEHILLIDNALWYNTYKTITFKHKVKPIDLFLYEPSFETYLNDISSQFTKTLV